MDRTYEYVGAYTPTEDPIRSRLAEAANPGATIRQISGKSDAELVIEAGIDFAIDPAFVHGEKNEDVERQIEAAMLDLIKEPIDTTNKKLDHFWEENFQEEAPGPVHAELSHLVTKLKGVAKNLRKDPRDQPLLHQFEDLNKRIVKFVVTSKRNFQERLRQKASIGYHPQVSSLEDRQKEVNAAIGLVGAYKDWVFKHPRRGGMSVKSLSLAELPAFIKNKTGITDKLALYQSLDLSVLKTAVQGTHANLRTAIPGAPTKYSFRGFGPGLLRGGRLREPGVSRSPLLDIY